MAIPSKAVGSGPVGTVQNVFRICFSQNLSAAPKYEAWDNGSTYPAVDASGSTTAKEIFAGTSGNSNKPYLSLYATSNAATTANWTPGSVTVGSANPNRLLGTTNYVTDPSTPTLLGSTPGAATLATASGSTLGIGAYKYEITFVNAYGETAGGTEASITTTTGNTNVSMTAIPTGPAGTTARNIYRTTVGGSSGTEKFLHQIADNTTTTYTDSTADGSLGPQPVPTVDSTAAIRFNMTGEFPYNATVPSSSSCNYLLQIRYNYTGSAPSLTYQYNDASAATPGTDTVPMWTTWVPGTNGMRHVNSGTSAGTYKLTLPTSGVVNTGEIWVTT